MSDKEKTVVVVPTYNERASIRELAEHIFALGIHNLAMLVVDDSSPDGTADVVRELQQNFPIKLLERAHKTGLGIAYVAAFNAILKDESTEYIIQMDADLSHDPKAISRLLEAAKTHDLVLGSRYIDGGSIENWGIARRIISRFGCLYARMVLGLPYKDLTGGFKCWRRDALSKIPIDQLSSVGYNFQIETTWLAHRLGLRICEVPITFVERKIGVSKFNLGIVLESFIKVLKLRIRGR